MVQHYNTVRLSRSATTMCAPETIRQCWISCHRGEYSGTATETYSQVFCFLKTSRTFRVCLQNVCIRLRRLGNQHAPICARIGWIITIHLPAITPVAGRSLRSRLRAGELLLRAHRAGFVPDSPAHQYGRLVNRYTPASGHPRARPRYPYRL